MLWPDQVLVRVLAAHVVGMKARQDQATRKRHNPEQVVRKLMAADRRLGEGKDVAAVPRVGCFGGDVSPLA